MNLLGQFFLWIGAGAIIIGALLEMWVNRSNNHKLNGLGHDIFGRGLIIGLIGLILKYYAASL